MTTHPHTLSIKYIWDKISRYVVRGTRVALREGASVSNSSDRVFPTCYEDQHIWIDIDRDKDPRVEIEHNSWKILTLIKWSGKIYWKQLHSFPSCLQKPATFNTHFLVFFFFFFAYLPFNWFFWTVLAYIFVVYIVYNPSQLLKIL